MVTGRYSTLQHVTDRYYSFLLLVITNNNIYKSGINTEDNLQNLNSWLTPTKGVPDITSGR